MALKRDPDLRPKPGGTGFQPVQSFQASRRNLPHWQEPGSVYFITWRYKTGNTLSPEERAITLKTLRYWDGIKWTLYAAVIMPDHVHILAQPLLQSEGAAHNLTAIIHSVKSFSAQQISRHRGKQAPIWQDERYDRIVRDEAELEEKYQYIRHNPVKEGLTTTPEEYPWLYEQTS